MTNKNGWVKTSDRLPRKEIGRILVCYYGLGYTAEEGFNLIEITQSEYVIETPENYPYWRKLPKIPFQK